jgi:hypothetical protein
MQLIIHPLSSHRSYLLIPYSTPHAPLVASHIVSSSRFLRPTLTMALLSPIYRRCHSSPSSTISSSPSLLPSSSSLTSSSSLKSGRSAELIIGALARAGEEGVNARLGKPVGSQFPLLPGRFQARIDDSRHPDRVQQAFKWEGPPGMKDPMDLENERARAGRTGQGLPMRRDELYTLPLLTQPKEKRQ